MADDEKPKHDISVTPSDIQSLTIEGTRIMVRKKDGSVATEKELTGSHLVAFNDQGVTETYRIDGIKKEKSDHGDELYFYTFSVRHPVSGEWMNFCRPDRNGEQKGFPISGYWDEKGNHIPSKTRYSITCTSGVIGKCILMGYLPWGKSVSGESLWKYHQACTRMLRGDYCGNGIPHTRNGTRVELFDRENIQVDTREPGLTFEAAWNENGAVCINKTRIKDIATIESILRECPEKLTGKTGPANCSESFDDPAVLILNRSGD